jgi:hypothetical protein
MPAHHCGVVCMFFKTLVFFVNTRFGRVLISLMWLVLQNSKCWRYRSRVGSFHHRPKRAQLYYHTILRRLRGVVCCSLGKNQYIVIGKFSMEVPFLTWYTCTFDKSSNLLREQKSDSTSRANYKKSTGVCLPVWLVCSIFINRINS